MISIHLDVNTKFLGCLFIPIFLFTSNIHAHEHKVIHPAVTDMATKQPTLEYYLINQLNLIGGFGTVFSEGKGSLTITDWLKYGSTEEDAHDVCQASNHFHNPLKSWDQSVMSDQSRLLDLWCRSWKPWYSNVTWATGKTSSPPGGKTVTFNSDSKLSPNTWIKARKNYLSALTAIERATRDSSYAMTFQALGQVLHLLQDMSIPAHVRNDFQSHLKFHGICFADQCSPLKPTDWFGNPFEDYVRLNKEILSSAGSRSLNLDRPIRLTDFWDTDRYTGNNPSSDWSQGLAEYTNANFFSDSTIPNNRPSEEHAFPYPQIDAANYQVCEEYAFDDQTMIKKYIYRKTPEGCPSLDQPRPLDRFSIASLLNQEDVVTDENISSIRLVLDEKIHDAYARRLLPPAIGYSSQLLGYFFRGKLEVKMLPVFNEDKILDHINLKIRNASSSQESLSGTKSQFTLTYGYNPEGGEPGDGVYNKKVGSINLPKDLPYGKDGAGNDLEGDDYEVEISAYVFPDGIPEERYPGIKFMLSYLGNLGEEKMDFSVDSSGKFNNYGAVIGKAFTAKPIRFFHEEWMNDPPPEYTWFQMESGLFGSNLYNDGIDHGLAENTIEAGRITKNNVRYAEESDYQYGPFEGGHFNMSLIGRHLRSGDEFSNNIFPIPITKDTYIQFKIDEMSMDPLPAVPAAVSTHHQGVELIFNNGYILQLSLNDQYWKDGDKVGYFTFSAGDIIVDNIHGMFKQWDMPIPEDFKLDRIAIIQQIGNDLPHNVEYRQRMIVDFFRVIEMERESAN